MQLSHQGQQSDANDKQDGKLKDTTVVFLACDEPPSILPAMTTPVPLLDDPVSRLSLCALNDDYPMIGISFP